MQATPSWARLSLQLPDESATARLAEDVAAMLQPGDLIALSGGLGAGKTTFARALIRALAGDPALEVPSPTFPLSVEHTLPRLKVTHADLYRLSESRELAEIGLDEALNGGAVLVEWPEALPASVAENRVDLHLGLNGTSRRAEITAQGSWPDRLSRTQEVRAFLDRSSWKNATRIPLAGDASHRMHERVVQGSSTAILMNAPVREPGPPIYGDRSYDDVAHRASGVRAFVAVDLGLRDRGVHAPEILAADIDTGLVLTEDLGDERIVDQTGAPFMERYEAAIDLLVFMHGLTWPAEVELPDGSSFRIPHYDQEALLVEASLFPDWFGGQGGEPAFPPRERSAFLGAWAEVLGKVDAAPATWVMRDFHSPNILWRPDAEGIARVGVIDFQDALIGHPAYDVASLVQDARVTLTHEQEAWLKSRYVARRREQDPAFDATTFESAVAVMGLQRATKVLGIFTRLALAEGKPGYQRHRQRLKHLIRSNLRHPVLSKLRVWYEPYF